MTYLLTEEQLYSILNRTYKAASIDYTVADLTQKEFETLKLRFKDCLKTQIKEAAE